jgi:hypothetical protein
MKMKSEESRSEGEKKKANKEIQSWDKTRNYIINTLMNYIASETVQMINICQCKLLKYRKNVISVEPCKWTKIPKPN